MYLSQLEVKNYRCLQNVKIDFRPGLNVIVGENNAGKTAVINALRLILTQGTGRREIYASEDELYHDSSGITGDRSFEIHTIFRELSTQERGAFSVCLAPSLGSDVAQIHFRFEAPPQGTRRRARVVTWGGEQEGDIIPADVLDCIRSVYLEPLRDVQIGLRPGRGSRISKLLQLIVTDDSERNRLTSIIDSANSSIEADQLVQRTKEQINNRLKGVTGSYLAQTADLHISPADFKQITESLRLFIGRGQPFNIDENGLGYNNLLFIAIVLSELQQAKAADEIDLPILLIEEPEAHLHPQLQTVLVDYLQNLPSISTTPNGMDNLSPAPVQVFVTTHSPNLASRVDLDSIIELYINPGLSQVTAYSIANCPLEDKEKQDLQRYLDVTKAQLFFGRGVLFVEGISEALLLPELARILGRPIEEYGVSIVNVQSLAFAPFARLFQEGALNIPAAIISDSDPSDPITEVLPDRPVPTLESPTATSLRQLESGNIIVRLAIKTFEYDLALAGNAGRMATEYSKLRTQKGRQMVEAIAAESTETDKAIAFWSNFDKNDKARFAQIMAQSLSENPDGFIVPEYLSEAINHVTQNSRAGDN